MADVNWLTGIIFPYINFILFVFLLWRLARKPAHAAAEKRSNEYKYLYEKSAKEYKEAKERLESLKSKYNSLEREMKSIEATAEEMAKKQTDLLLLEAEKISQALEADAQNIARREAARAKQLLQEELWVKAKEELLDRVRSEFTVKKQKEYMWSSLADVKSAEK